MESLQIFVILNRHIVPLGLDEHLPLDNAILELPPQQHLLLLQLGEDITILSGSTERWIIAI